jgi:hypothetical protein
MDNAMAMKAKLMDGGRGPAGRISADACARLYQQHGARLFRLAYWVLLGDRQAAARLLHGAFARCVSAASAEDSAERLGHQWEGLSVRALREVAPAGKADHDAAAVNVAALEPEPRLAFLLHDASGYSLDRCAELLQVPPDACRQLLFAARLQLCQSGGLWRDAPAA